MKITLAKSMIQFSIALIVIAIFAGGCAYLPPRYDNVQSARQGTPNHGTLSRDDAFGWETGRFSLENQGLDLETRRMTVEKLRNATPEIGVSPDGTPQGFLGIVKNFSERETYNFIIRGPENVAFLLGPGQQKEHYLVPGGYRCFVYRDNRRVGEPWIFQVSLQKQYFLDQWVHWYVFMKR
jgi:hypothetical protein